MSHRYKLNFTKKKEENNTTQNHVVNIFCSNYYYYYYFYEVWNVGIDLVRNMKSYTLYRFHEQIG